MPVRKRSLYLVQQMRFDPFFTPLFIDFFFKRTSHLLCEDLYVHGELVGGSLDDVLAPGLVHQVLVLGPDLVQLETHCYFPHMSN